MPTGTTQPAPGTDRAIARARAAGERYRLLPAARRAALLRGIAATLETARPRVISLASRETALTAAELSPEFDRATATLRLFASIIADHRWARPSIDPADTSPSIGPPHDLRRMLIPLDGPVLVLGASNFPLAYGVLGGDTASALAAGCAVIVKEHPAHPRTGRLLARLAARAASGALPRGLHPLVYVPLAGADDLSMMPSLIGAASGIGFTGSVQAGTALARSAADRLDALGRPEPIPLFAEMGSLNRVLVSRGALARRGPRIADEVAAAVLARHGQQCTKPGLVFLDAAPGQARAAADFARRLAATLDAAPARRMLSATVAQRYLAGCRRLAAAAGVRLITRRELPMAPSTLVPPVVFSTLADSGLQPALPAATLDALAHEVFGPCVVVAGAGLEPDPRLSPGCLATALYAQPPELRRLAADGTLDRLTRRTGRLVFNGVTTGVRVGAATVHGGPFPATNRPDAPAVGHSAIERWCRPVCFQNAPPAALPAALRRPPSRPVSGQPRRRSRA